MRIDNNYTQRQPNFGRLKSIEYKRDYYTTEYAKEIAELLQTIKESKAFDQFFKQYDADMFISCGSGEIEEPFFVNMTLKTKLPKTKYNKRYAEIEFEAKEAPEDEVSLFREVVFDKLAQTIKNMEFSDLKKKLDYSLELLEDSEQDEKVNSMYRAKIDDITHSMLKQDFSEGAKKKTFFEKIFGWLK